MRLSLGCPLFKIEQKTYDPVARAQNSEFIAPDSSSNSLSRDSCSRKFPKYSPLYLPVSSGFSVGYFVQLCPYLALEFRSLIQNFQASARIFSCKIFLKPMNGRRKFSARLTGA